MQTEIAERLSRYAKISTASSFENKQCPSTHCQFDLAKLLYSELEVLGMNPELTDKCIIYSYFNKQNTQKRIVLNAHLDVSPDAPSVNVKPQVQEYDGTDLVLEHTTIKKEHLNCEIGSKVMTTDGSTLLGGDCKTGISIIMTVMEKLSKLEPEKVKLLPSICVCFTPDEEIGLCGIKHVDIQKLTDGIKDSFGLTLDGGRNHEITLNTFNAYSFTLDIKGNNCHPGDAYHKMVSSAALACKFIQVVSERITAPQNSQIDDGYVFVQKVDLQTEQSHVSGIIRSFSETEIGKFKEQLHAIARETISPAYFYLKFTLQYQNMRVFLPDQLVQKLQKHGRNYKSTCPKFRGGTDGAFLSQNGLPTPNIFTGTGNFHSVQEYVVLSEAEEAVKFLMEVIGDSE